MTGEVVAAAPRRLLRPALSVGAIYLAARAITTVFLLVGAEIANRTGGGACFELRLPYG